MGNQKQKWTAEEEDALHRGVQKHGAGKWKNILKDPEFAPALASRSNIDLKDKWRNLSVGSGQGSKDKSRTPKIKAIVPVASPIATTQNAAAAAAAPVATPQSATPQTQPQHPSNNSDDAKIPPRYNAMIFEALSAIKDTNGSDINAIVRFIEQKHQVPQNFRRALGSRLRRLVNQGKLEKVQNCFKIKKDTPMAAMSPARVKKEPALGVKLSTQKPPAPKPKDVCPRQSPTSSFLTSNETIKDAADAAAYRVADAENKSFLAAEAVKEVDRISKLAEDTDSMLQFAKEIYEQCTADKKPYLLISKFFNHNLVS